MRAVYRRVRFGPLSYSLPHDRASRIACNPVVLDPVTPPGGHSRFDPGTYCSPESAGRRLFRG